MAKAKVVRSKKKAAQRPPALTWALGLLFFVLSMVFLAQAMIVA